MKKISLVLLIITVISACSTNIEEKIIPKIIKKLLHDNSVKIIGLQKKDQNYIVKTKMYTDSISETVFFKICKYNSGWQIDEFKIGTGKWTIYPDYKSFKEQLKNLTNTPSFSKSDADEILTKEIPDYNHLIIEFKKKDDSYIAETKIIVNQKDVEVNFSFNTNNGEWTIDKFCKKGGEWSPFIQFQDEIGKDDSSFLSHNDVIRILEDNDLGLTADLDGMRFENNYYIVKVNYYEIPMIMISYYKISKYDTGWRIDSYKIKGSEKRWYHFENMEKTFKYLSKGYIAGTINIMNYIVQGIRMYITDRSYPPAARNIYELARYIANYVNPILKKDLWGNELIYKMWVDKKNGVKHYNLISAGADGELDSDDDIIFSDGKLLNPKVLY